MGLSIWHVIIVLMVVLIIFGAGKLPSVMGDVAKGVRNFKEGLRGEEEPKGEIPHQLHTGPAAPAASPGQTAQSAPAASRNDDMAKT